jgi:hypothetical protein
MADLVLLPGDPVADIRALNRIAMVVKDGTVYFPEEAYRALGIKPFTDRPAVAGTPLVPLRQGS